MKHDLLKSEIKTIVFMSASNPDPSMLHFIAKVLVDPDSDDELCTNCLGYFVNLSAKSSVSRQICFNLLSKLVTSPELRPKVVRSMNYYLTILNPSSGILGWERPQFLP